MIYSIQRFSIHDGVGIRTILFFKGCGLSCPWCSNPESQEIGPELMFQKRSCIACGSCNAIEGKTIVDITKNNQFYPSNAVEVEKYRDCCPSKALIVMGEKIDTNAIITELEKDAPFFKTSHGGITFSGGEALLQSTACVEIAKELKKRGYSIHIETCLHVPWSNIEQMVPYVDSFLCDVKHIDPTIFRKVTGGDLKLIMNNLQKLSQIHSEFRVRIPVIPGFNHTIEVIRAIVESVVNLPGLQGIDFMPYHAMGAGKYEELARPYALPMTSLDYKEVEPYYNYVQSLGISTTIGG